MMRLKPTAASSVEFFHIVTFPQERHVVDLAAPGHGWTDCFGRHLTQIILIDPTQVNHDCHLSNLSTKSQDARGKPPPFPHRLQYHKPPKCHHADGILTEMSRITKNSSLHSHVLRGRRTEYYLHFKCHCGGQNQYFPRLCLGALYILSSLK